MCVKDIKHGFKEFLEVDDFKHKDKYYETEEENYTGVISKLRLGLLALNGILPKEEMLEVFQEYLEEFDYTCLNNGLLLNGNFIKHKL